MSVKTSLLQILEENRDQSVSGQELADRLSVSRAAVWKAMKSLQTDGHKILAVTNRGYRLESDSDVLSPEGVASYLSPPYRNVTVLTQKSLQSTNSFAKMLAVNGAESGTIVLADEQTEGRGRMGRRFYSPTQTGVYMSVILRPQGQVSDLLILTIAAAVAVSRTIERLTASKVGIKWVNDIIVDGKKVSGILTEAVGDFESGMVESVIVGIGVNIRPPANRFPPELQKIAGALAGPGASRNRWAAEIANELLAFSDNLPNRDFLEDYRERSLLLGQEICYLNGGNPGQGTAVEINDCGNLVVETANGRIVLRSGEVTVRRSFTNDQKSC